MVKSAVCVGLTRFFMALGDKYAKANEDTLIGLLSAKNVRWKF